MARIIKPGTRLQMVFRGKCPSCWAVIEASRGELSVEQCMREHYEFAHFSCLQCNSRMVLHPSKGDSHGQPG